MIEHNIVIVIISSATGVFGSLIVQQILNRRKILSYYVQHHYFGSSVQDSNFGNVEIRLYDNIIQNLYLSSVEVNNESTRDLEDIKITVYTNETNLLTEYSQLLGTTELVNYSPEYKDKISVSDSNSPTNEQIKLYRSRREYLIPVLNRGQKIRFQYLNTSETEDQPTIWLESIHPGVSVKFRTPKPLIHGIQQPVAAISGICAGLVFTVLITEYNTFVWLTSFSCLLFGFVAQIPGAYIVRAIRKFQHLLNG